MEKYCIECDIQLKNDSEYQVFNKNRSEYDDECYFKCNECCGEHKTKIILRNDLAKNRKKIGKVKDLLEDDYGRIW